MCNVLYCITHNTVSFYYFHWRHFKHSVHFQICMMGKLFGKQMHSKFALRYCCTHPEDEDDPPRDVPEGSFVVYVGDEMRRFVITSQILHHHLFRELLARSSEEFGHKPNGSLVMNCDVPFFKHLLHAIDADYPSIMERRVAALASVWWYG